ncbi:MAG: AAA family ATPase [Acidobacteria bacterium]|nr:AAA family ATPase [Acidobacteriota bacterium]
MIDPVLKSKWAIRTPGDLRRACSSTPRKYLINDLIPQQSVGIVVGDSGLGKSPLLYQAAMCIAAGLPFLDHAVRQTSVLYLDFENGLGEVDEIMSGLARPLGLVDAPDDLLLWNVNDCSPKWGQPGHGLEELISDIRPGLAILDPLNACYQDIEEKNSQAVRILQRFRKYWFLQTRGPRALINACDLRLGVDKPGSSAVNAEVALVLRGFRRVRGEIPTTYLARVDDDGDPLGYRRITGAGLLFNPDQQAVFAKLPDCFRFKNAQLAYGKGAQATTDFLNKCINVGILRRADRGYEKVTL